MIRSDRYNALAARFSRLQELLALGIGSSGGSRSRNCSTINIPTISKRRPGLAVDAVLLSVFSYAIWQRTGLSYQRGYFTNMFSSIWPCRKEINRLTVATVIQREYEKFFNANKRVKNNLAFAGSSTYQRHRSQGFYYDLVKGAKI